jgi:hypothetical protein
LAVEVLPALSTANVRELLKAVFPLPQLTLEQATDLVIMHLGNYPGRLRTPMSSAFTAFLGKE